MKLARLAASAGLLAGSLALAGRALADNAPTQAPTAGATLQTGVSGISVALVPPPGWAPMDAADVPEIDVSSVPGAEVTLRAGFARPAREGRAPHRDRLVLVCAKAPTDHYAPGLEAMVFDRMNGFARAELEKQASVDRFEALEITADGLRQEQRFTASGEVGHQKQGGKVAVGIEPADRGKPVQMRAEGRHMLGFAGTPVVIVACSVACAEAAAPAGAGACGAALESIAYEGPFGKPPSPGVVARALVAVAERPLAAGGVALGGVVFLVGVLLTFRPRPRP